MIKVCTSAVYMHGIYTDLIILHAEDIFLHTVSFDLEIISGMNKTKIIPCQVDIPKSNRDLQSSDKPPPKRFINDTLIVALSILIFLAIVW